MVPAVFGAWKAASMGWRIASIVTPIVIVLSLMGWAYHKGKVACEKSHTAEMVAQALDVADHTVAKSEHLDEVAARHEQRTSQQSTARAELEREVGSYVQNPKTTCDLDAEYVALLERIIELHPTSQGGVSQANPSPTGAPAVPAPSVTTTELLRAFHDLTDARRDDVEALMYWKEFDATRYSAEMRWYHGLSPESRGEVE